MEKERILDVLFWVGFFATLILLFLNSITFLIGVVLVLLSIIVDFSARRIIIRDVYVLGYFLGAMFTVVAIKKTNIPAFSIGVALMLVSIVVHKLVAKRIEKKEKKFSAPDISKLFHHKLHQEKYKLENKYKEQTLKKKPHILSILWCIFSVAILVIAVVINSKYFLYLGLIISMLAVIINIIDKKQKPRIEVKKPEVKKEPIVKAEKKKVTTQEQKLAEMKRFITLKQDKYETDIDKLYRLLEKYKKVKISEIKKIFSISNEKAEEWAKILEEHNLGHFHYPAFGEPEIQWKQ